MLPHLADQLGDSIPVLFATSIVELLDIMRRFYRVGLELHTGNQYAVNAYEAVKAERELGQKGRGGRQGKGGLWSKGHLPCCLVYKRARTTKTYRDEACDMSILSRLYGMSAVLLCGCYVGFLV